MKATEVSERLESLDVVPITRREILKRSAGLGLFGLLSAKTLWGDGEMEVCGVRLPEWAVCEIRDGVARYRVWKGADEAVAFPLMTDIHSHLGATSPDRNWSDPKSHVLFQRAVAREVGADFLANLGDLDLDVNILGSAPAMDKVQAVIDDYAGLYAHEDRPVLFAMGNHDHAKGRFTSKQFGDAFNRGVNGEKAGLLHLSEDGTWGYLDLADKKFRAIFLNTSDEGYLGFSAGQMQTLSNALSSAGEGWHVAVLQHANIPGFIASWRRFISDGNFKRSGIEMQMIEDFANHRGDLVQGFHNPPIRGEFDGVKWDFGKSRANLVGVFQGHLHAESYLKYAKVNYVIRPGYGTIPLDCRCGEWRDSKRDAATGRSVFVPSKSMMIDLVAVKPERRQVHVFRIGFGGPESELEYAY